MARSSNISLNIQANTQKALNQFKSFSSDLKNKFLISGLQLDVVRNALSSINREFERYAGGGGLTEAIQTQQLTRSLQTSLSLVQGYSVEVSKAISENIGLALSKVNQQVGGSRDDIAAFTTDVSTAINQQVALGLTGTKNVAEANAQLFSLMQRLKLTYGESIEKTAPMFQKVLLNQASMSELLNSVSSGTGNIFTEAALQTGGQLGNMSGVNRGAFFKKVMEILDKQAPSMEELIKTNPQAILGRLMNTLFDDRIGIFGALRKIKLPTGGSTTILTEGAELLNALFGDKGLLLTLVREIGRAFGVKDANDAGLVIVNLIDFFTSITEKLTSILQTPQMRENLRKVADVIKGFGQFISDVLNSLLGTGTLGQTQINQLGDALASALEVFAQVLTVALAKLAPKIGNAIWIGIQGLTQGLFKFVSGNPLGQLLGLGGLGFGAFKAFQGYSALDGIKQEEIKKLNNQIKQNNKDLKFFSQQEVLRQEQLALVKQEIAQKQKQLTLGGNTAILSKELNELKVKETTLQSQVNVVSSQKSTLTAMNASAEGNLLRLKTQSSRLEMLGIAIKSRMTSMLMRGLGAGLLGGALEAGTSLAMGESWQRALTKGGINLLGSGLGFAIGGPAGAMIGGLLASSFSGAAADKLGFTKYNGNFPIAANGLFGAMNKESLMSGNKGLVIANQDEIIVPPHRMAQLAGMVRGSSSGETYQYALNEKFKKYQEDQKKQMTELIREIRVGNTIKRDQTIATAQSVAPSTINQNTYNNKIEAKDLKEAAPTGWWDSLKSGIQNLWQNVTGAITGQRAGGNIPSNFLSMYKSEMNAYGGRPVLANDKELIVSPRNYATLASLMRSAGGGSGASINNQITINVSSNGEVDTNKIANAVMKAIDTKYKEVYESLSYV